MTDLTALDILVNPGDDTIRHARQWNARMRESVPSGFALDATHQPHITTLQRFVRTAGLDGVHAAVDQTLAATDVAALSYRAVALRHGDWGVPGQGLAVIVIQPSSQVLDVQAALLAAVTPFTDSGGTAAAFVTDPGEQISQSTIDWVDGFVLDALEVLERERGRRRTARPTRPASRSTTSATAAQPAGGSRRGR